MVSDLTVLSDVTTGTNTIYVMTNSTDGQRKPPTHQPKDIKLTISLSLPPKDNPLPIPPREGGD